MDFLNVFLIMSKQDFINREALLTNQLSRQQQVIKL